jgi:plasmid stability protein
MSKMIQIRNVPDDLHRTLKARAAMAGQSLSDYLLGELRGLAERPSLEEWLARVEAREHVKPRTAAAAIIRALRGKI